MSSKSWQRTTTRNEAKGRRVNSVQGSPPILALPFSIATSSASIKLACVVNSGHYLCFFPLPRALFSFLVMTLVVHDLCTDGCTINKFITK